MNINVISIFPEIIESSFKGLTGKALEKNIAELKLIDLKEFSNNDYGAVDDAPSVSYTHLTLPTSAIV